MSIPTTHQPFTRRSLVDAFADALQADPAQDPVTLLAQMLGVAAPGVQPGDVEAVWLAWLEATGRSRAKLDRKRRELVRRRLRDYPVADLVDAVRGWRHDPFHSGANAGQRVYNDLELLLRDAAHVERFRDLERDAASRPGYASGRLAATLRALREGTA